MTLKNLFKKNANKLTAASQAIQLQHEQRRKAEATAPLQNPATNAQSERFALFLELTSSDTDISQF